MTYAAENYARNLAEIADSLRRLADRVQTDGVPYEAGDRRVRVALDLGDVVFPEHSPTVSASQRVIHAVTWGLANLDLPGLVSAAERADRAARDGEEY